MANDRRFLPITRFISVCLRRSCFDDEETLRKEEKRSDGG
jgi:hypothetical protein